METFDKLFVNKYQPLFFNDFGVDDEIIKILKTMILMDNLNILLIGDIASGKTSLLNCLIREYYKGHNPKEYEDNVMNINNLKEQGINYYRNDVKTFCQTCSVIKGKKKFIVLDDIDIINEQSQQVFRNCIDKFSHNVHFISSCSNNQKVIESIQSRLTIIKIKPLQKEQLFKIINKIKINENISMNADAEEFIVNISNKPVKILINYMEKFKLVNEHITFNLAVMLCSNISFITFEDYTNLIKNKKLNEAIQLIYEIYDKGYSVMDILDNYFLFVKNTTLLDETEKYNVSPIICKYITIFHNIHEDEIELALFTNNLISILCV
jgi:DNA polymerase III delta prime subunit